MNESYAKFNILCDVCPDELQRSRKWNESGFCRAPIYISSVLASLTPMDFVSTEMKLQVRKHEIINADGMSSRCVLAKTMHRTKDVDLPCGIEKGVSSRFIWAILSYGIVPEWISSVMRIILTRANALAARKHAALLHKTCFLIARFADKMP